LVVIDSTEDAHPGSIIGAMRSVSRLAPPLLLMGLIFFLSAQPDLSSGLGTWDLILRKLAHMAEYGLLWFLWWRALGYRNAAIPAAIAIGYSITDELHQATVEGRHGTPVDVLIDSAGVALAYLAIRFRARRRSGSVAS
jgi:VanZ family protein